MNRPIDCTTWVILRKSIFWLSPPVPTSDANGIVISETINSAIIIPKSKKKRKKNSLDQLPIPWNMVLLIINYLICYAEYTYTTTLF